MVGRAAPPPTRAPSSPEIRRKRVAMLPAPGSPPKSRRFSTIADVMRRTRLMIVDTPPTLQPFSPPSPRVPMVDLATPPSTPPTSSPELPRKRVAMLPAPGSPPKSLRFASIADVMRRTRLMVMDRPPRVLRARHEGVLCGECEAGDCEEELLLCDRCDRGRHTFCLDPVLDAVPLAPWLCPDCVPSPGSIISFFRIQTGADDPQPENRGRSQDAKRRRRSSYGTHKKKRKMLPYVASEEGVQRFKQMASAATALISSKMEFSNELTYMPSMAPKSSNQSKLQEGGIQVLSKEDKETIERCRRMQKRGECPPLVVVFDSREGFTVLADANIKDMTFIAEITGDVDYWLNREYDSTNNSITTLLSTADPSKDLVICSDKRGNVSRFISGINNHAPDGKKKQNVKSVRYNIDGENHVLLVACRDIAHGEKLYFDYNEFEYMYPTDQFI